MKRHPREFPDVATDAGEAVESVRKALDVTVSDLALLEDRLPDDPPRTARIGITYTAGTPEQALIMAREAGEPGRQLDAASRRRHGQK